MTAAPFTIERTLQASVADVWKAISDKDEMKKWYFDLPGFRAEVGYAFTFLGGKDEQHPYTHICVVTEVIPFKKLSYSWRYDGYEGMSYVTFELFEEEKKEGLVQTRLTLTHRGLDTFPANNPDLAAKNFAEGWIHIIGTSLKTFLESEKK